MGRWGTPAENLQDSYERNTVFREKSERNCRNLGVRRRQLLPSQVDYMRHLMNAGYSTSEVARWYGVGQTVALRIKNNEHYAYSIEMPLIPASVSRERLRVSLLTLNDFGRLVRLRNGAVYKLIKNPNRNRHKYPFKAGHFSYGYDGVWCCGNPATDVNIVEVGDALASIKPTVTKE